MAPKQPASFPQGGGAPVVGQETSGVQRSTAANPKTQPGSLPIGGDVDPADNESQDGVISDNYPVTRSANRLAGRMGPEVTGQDERGFVQTDAGKVPTTNTSAGRVRSIPSP